MAKKKVETPKRCTILVASDYQIYQCGQYDNVQAALNHMNGLGDDFEISDGDSIYVMTSDLVLHEVTTEPSRRYFIKSALEIS